MIINFEYNDTIGELIKYLKEFPVNSNVKLTGTISSINDINKIGITSELIKYDKNGNKIYYAAHNDSTLVYEEWNSYDENGNKIYHKNSDGFEQWYEYNDKNQRTHVYTSDRGYAMIYNDKGEVIRIDNFSITEEKFKELKNSINCI